MCLTNVTSDHYTTLMIGAVSSHLLVRDDQLDDRQAVEDSNGQQVPVTGAGNGQLSDQCPVRSTPSSNSMWRIFAMVCLLVLGWLIPTA